MARILNSVVDLEAVGLAPEAESLEDEDEDEDEELPDVDEFEDVVVELLLPTVL